MNKFEIPKVHANKITEAIKEKSGPFGLANSYKVKDKRGLTEEVTISHRLGLRGRTPKVRITDMDTVEREGRQVRPFVQMEVRGQEVTLTTGSRGGGWLPRDNSDSRSIFVEPHRVTQLRDFTNTVPRTVAAMLEEGVRKAEPKDNKVIKVGPWRGETIAKRKQDREPSRLVQ